VNRPNSAFVAGARILIVLAGIIASLCLSAFAAEQRGDPIVGRWNWHNHTILLIHANGTCGWTETDGIGTWKCVEPSQDPRKYILDWNRGQYVETLYLKKHASKISGHDQFGHRVWGVRIED
jgi:hypothetical protein